jgi:hypothetical protein
MFLICSTYYIWKYSMELGERGEGKENDRASAIIT